MSGNFGSPEEAKVGLWADLTQAVQVQDSSRGGRSGSQKGKCEEERPESVNCVGWGKLPFQCLPLSYSVSNTACKAPRGQGRLRPRLQGVEL